MGLAARILERQNRGCGKIGGDAAENLHGKWEDVVYARRGDGMGDGMAAATGGHGELLKDVERIEVDVRRSLYRMMSRCSVVQAQFGLV